LFRGGKLLIINDNEYIDSPVLKKVYQNGQFLYAGKWIPGLLSNFRRFFRVMKRLQRKAQKTNNFILKKKLFLLKFMKILPSILFLLNSKYQLFPIRESLQLKIPSIGIVDNRLNPYIYSYAIAGNLSMRGALNTYMNIVLESCKHAEILKRLSYKKIKFNKLS